MQDFFISIKYLKRAVTREAAPVLWLGWRYHERRSKLRLHTES